MAISKSVFDNSYISDRVFTSVYPKQIGLGPSSTAAVTDRVIQHVKAAGVSDLVLATTYIPKWWSFNVDSITLGDSVTVKITRFVTDNITTFDDHTVHIKAGTLADSVTATEVIGVGPPPINNNATIQDTVMLAVQKIATASVSIIDTTTITVDGTAIVHSVDILAIQDFVFSTIDKTGIFVGAGGQPYGRSAGDPQRDIGLKDSVVAGSTTAGLTVYAMVIEDDVGVPSVATASVAVQETVQIVDDITAGDNGIESVVITIGTPTTVAVTIVDDLAVPEYKEATLGYAPVLNSAGVTDFIQSGRGFPNKIGLTDVVSIYPNKIYLIQPASFLEDVRKRRTSVPALQRAPEDITYRGIALPTAQLAYPHIKEEWELIRDSLVTILLTKKGQRLFVPDFGSNLWRVIFEPNDTVTASLAREYVISAIQKWEPRVIVRNVSVTSDEHILTVFISVVIRRINQFYNLRLDISRDSFTFERIASEAA